MAAPSATTSWSLEDCGVGDHWIANNVTPHIKRAFSCNLAVVLGKALLWACFDPEARESVDCRLRERITEADATEVHNNPSAVVNAEGELHNPICKRKFVVFERNATAVIQEVDNVAPVGNATTTMPAGARVVDATRHNQQFESAVMTQFAVVNDRQRAIQQEQRDMFRQFSTKQRAQDCLLQRLAHFALAPPRR
jgi:hypothetical protein